MTVMTREPTCSAGGAAGAWEADGVRVLVVEDEIRQAAALKRGLEAEGFAVDDRLLRTREEVDAFKDAEQVATTPQVFVDGERIGGADDLEDWLAAA